MHGAALRHRQAVAQLVVAPEPGGPDQTAPDRHPARCQTSVRHPLPSPERLGAVPTHWIIPKLSIDSQ